MKLNFDNTFVTEMEGLYVACSPERCASPQLVYLNTSLAGEMGYELDVSEQRALAGVFSGNTPIEGACPIAQAYAGHQFGHFNPQLGDGRAVILGETLSPQGERFDLCLKGSGRTPFSRGGDGLAALGPMLREVLISEYMHAVDIPTTRSLAVVATGSSVYRDSELPGAILTRTAASHIRIGTFEYCAAQRQHDTVRQLADYSIVRHFPWFADEQDKYLLFLREVVKRQASLIAKWMGVGFIHGVMNTDNMTIAGETIDYGPCAFMEAYSPDAVFSSIDHHGRYAYKNQPPIAQWNLARFAESIVPLIDEDQNTAVEMATAEVQAFDDIFRDHWLAVMRGKLGLSAEGTASAATEEHDDLIDSWLDLLQKKQADFTQAFYLLSDAAIDNDEELSKFFSYSSEFESWFKQWRYRLNPDNNEARANKIAQCMKNNNPWITPRNHRVEEALDAANVGELELFERLVRALENPLVFNPAFEQLTQPASNLFTADYQTFCGT